MKKYMYLISQDLQMLFANWAKEFDFNIPGKTYFANISQGIVCDLQSIFSREREDVAVQLISFDQMYNGLQKKLSSRFNDLIISLDKVYLPSNFQLEINRIVCKKENEWEDLGECSRPGFKSIDQQLDEICSSVNGARVTVVDDGCWSGGSIALVLKALRNRNINISKVLVGVFVDSGKLSLDIPLEFAIRFSANSVIDWICERDFFPGAPLGGRTVKIDSNNGGTNKSYGAYYLFGMGDYANWASLQFEDKLIRSFTQRCIGRSIALFNEIEELSSKAVLMNNLSRLPYGIGFNCQDRFVDVLERQLVKII